MRNVTIRRCPVCDTIKSRTDDLVTELQDDPELRVNVVDGAKGEFSVEVEGEPIVASSGDSPRDAAELAAEIRVRTPRRPAEGIEQPPGDGAVLAGFTRRPAPGTTT